MSLSVLTKLCTTWHIAMISPTEPKLTGISASGGLSSRVRSLPHNERRGVRLNVRLDAWLDSF